jgi:hypothetical protein
MSYAISLAKMVAYFANNRLLPDLDEQQMSFIACESSGISENRENLVKDSLAVPDVTHLLFIDDDMGFHWSALHIMMQRRQPIVACTYRRRQPPGEFTASSADGKQYIRVDDESSGLREAANVGFGFCLIERRVVEAVRPPRFLNIWVEKDQRYSTEDFPFFRTARELGFPVYVDLDASKRVWHEGSMQYSWRGNYADIMPPPDPPAPTAPLQPVQGENAST